MPVHLLLKKQGNGCFLLYTEPPRGYIVTNDTCALRAKTFTLHHLKLIMKLRFWGSCVLPLAFAACAVYTPMPVDLQRDSVEWRQLSAKMCQSSNPLTLEALHEIGLLLNPELNLARLG